jgi:hypothetical protein
MPFVRKEAAYSSGLPSLKPEQYSEVILELIRCDIPVLVEGASSIGKSYSLTKFVESNVNSHAFLFIGSEKSEYIEGIPEIRLAKDEVFLYAPILVPRCAQDSPVTQSGES